MTMNQRLIYGALMAVVVLFVGQFVLAVGSFLLNVVFAIAMGVFAIIAVSIATGMCAAVLTWSLGLDFPLLWAMIAFLLNYVPTIGSIMLHDVSPDQNAVMLKGRLEYRVAVASFQQLLGPFQSSLKVRFCFDHDAIGT